MYRSALLALAMLAGACADGPAPISRAGPVAGGYGPANPSDPNLPDAERLAVDEIYRRDPQRSLVESVTREAQVVAGMNYRFTIRMSGTGTYRVIVFKPLEGAMSITSFEKFLSTN